MMNDSHDLELVFRSRIPIVVIETREESRALDLLKSLRTRLGQPLYRWSITEGLVSLEFDLSIENDYTEPPEILKHIKQASRPGIYVLIDFHPFLNEPLHVRLLKDIVQANRDNGQTVVLLSHNLTIPDELKNHTAQFELSLPDQNSIDSIIRDTARQWVKDHGGQKVKTDPEVYSRLIQNLSGLTATEVRRLAHNVIYDDGAIRDNDLPQLMQAKYQLLNKDGILHFEYETERFADVGGFQRLKQWLEQRRAAFLQQARGLDMPRGILLLGIQGGGKSLAAKASAGIWGIPLLRFDVAALYNKYHGETERNLRESLKAAETMAPCVLWIDEIEKALGDADSDGGTSKRVLGTLLTWMAEKTRPVFLVATANDIQSLPPELVRKGRFDEVFFVDLPDLATRRQIFEIHLRKREHDPLYFSLVELARACEGFSGAEIEQVVVAGLYAAHAQQSPLDDQHLREAIEQTRPLSVLMAEKIAGLREWARERTVPVH